MCKCAIAGQNLFFAQTARLKNSCTQNEQYQSNFFKLLYLHHRKNSKFNAIIINNRIIYGVHLFLSFNRENKIKKILNFGAFCTKSPNFKEFYKIHAYINVYNNRNLPIFLKIVHLKTLFIEVF